MSKIVSCFLLLALNMNAFAETLVLDEVEVIGNKEGRTYSETPESVTILPPTRLNRGDQSNSLEVLNGQTNVQVNRNGENFSIRGINSSGVTGFQKDNLASVFLDDVFQTDLAMRAGGFEVWDLESLEIHRGPQSTSQGVNSLAGAILLQHYAPHQEKEAALKLGYGSFNRREVGAVINAPIGKKFATRLSFNKDANDGFIKNKTTGNAKWGRQDKGHAVADFKYFFDDKSELRFNNKFLRTDNGGQYTIGSNPFDYEVREDQDFRSITNNQQNSVQYVRPIGSSLSNKTTLAFSKSYQRNKLDGDGSPTNQAGTRREFGRDQFISLENVLAYKSDRVKNALGLHIHQFRSYTNYDLTLLNPNPVIPIDLVQDLDKTRDTYAIFDSMLYQFDRHHALNLGGRFEVVNHAYGTNVDPTLTGNGPVDNYLNSVRGSYKGANDSRIFLPKIGYLYQNANHTYGLTYSQGYRIGGLDINRERAQAVKYDPERTDNYELSWKQSSSNFTSQANVFYTYWKDQQVETRLSSRFYDSQVENASRSELYGGELEGTYTWDSGDSLRAGIGHVHTRFLGFTNNGRSYQGNEFPDAANWTIQSAWGHPFTDRISSNLTARYLSTSYTNAENTLKAPEQYYLDVNLQYGSDSFIWELNAKNVTDQGYVLSKSAIYNDTYQRVNRPRELGTRVTFFW